MKILGIETSCDETAVAVVCDALNPLQRILSQSIFSQDHQKYGGVVPEMAARSHLTSLAPMVEQVVKDAHISFDHLDAIAVTTGPGLVGGLLVGMMVGKGIALATHKPFFSINHLEGHALTPRLTHQIEFPYLLLLASGGHCQILEVLGVGNYICLGQTRDDAAGEAFDKVAKMLGLPYPGGPAIETLAKFGDPLRFDLPVPLKNSPFVEFSFSGLKTAVRLLIQKQSPLLEQDRADIAASFQKTVALSFKMNLLKALSVSATRHSRLVVSGGVAANCNIREQLQNLAKDKGMEFIAPPIKLCTDNGAMIAWAAIERYKLGEAPNFNCSAMPRWNLAAMA